VGQSVKEPVVILHETPELIVVNKPAGMSVHGGHRAGSTLLTYLKREREADFFPLHRLDRETSGVIALAKTGPDAARYGELLNKNGVKIYYAVVKGRFDLRRFKIDKPIEDHGKQLSALTEVRMIQGFGPYSLVECRLETGRWHQIRIHLASIEKHVVGDELHGDFALNKELKSKYKIDGLFLHARELRLTGGAVYRGFNVKAPLPKRFTDLLKIYNVVLKD
jgi:23S rRNA pseudouridine955/2504/2580 synthase